MAENPFQEPFRDQGKADFLIEDVGREEGIYDDVDLFGWARQDIDSLCTRHYYIFESFNGARNTPTTITHFPLEFFPPRFLKSGLSCP